MVAGNRKICGFLQPFFGLLPGSAEPLCDPACLQVEDRPLHLPDGFPSGACIPRLGVVTEVLAGYSKDELDMIADVVIAILQNLRK